MKAKKSWGDDRFSTFVAQQRNKDQTVQTQGDTDACKLQHCNYVRDTIYKGCPWTQNNKFVGLLVGKLGVYRVVARANKIGADSQ